jgi:hypothetical protein
MQCDHDIISIHSYLKIIIMKLFQKVTTFTLKLLYNAMQLCHLKKNNIKGICVTHTGVMSKFFPNIIQHSSKVYRFAKFIKYFNGLRWTEIPITP